MFEVITEQEFNESGALPNEAVSSAAAVVDTVTPDSAGVSEEAALVSGDLPQTGPRVYCTFCKAYYYEEYHYGRTE